MSDLVSNAEDRFSRDTVHFSLVERRSVVGYPTRFDSNQSYHLQTLECLEIPDIETRLVEILYYPGSEQQRC